MPRPVESLPRIASLLPSATEMVCALGLGEQLVGVSHECDWPPEVRGLPVLTSARLNPAGKTSREIDRGVHRLVADALAVYEIDLQGLENARPDIIVTQDLCEVCAVSFEDVRAAARKIANPDLQVVNVHPRCLADIWEDVRRIGRACGRDRAAADVVGSATRAIAGIAAHTRDLDRPLILTIEWIDPVMIGGLWMPELIDLAGGRCLVTHPGDLAHTLTAEDLGSLDPAPEKVLIKPCGYPIEQTLAEEESLASLFRDFDWPAVRRDEIYVADGNAFFNRPGPRIVDSLEILAACIHPDVFPSLGKKHADHFIRWTDGAG